jgi:DNA-binding response OmpR family regulator
VTTNASAWFLLSITLLLPSHVRPMPDTGSHSAVPVSAHAVRTVLVVGAGRLVEARVVALARYGISARSVTATALFRVPGSPVAPDAVLVYPTHRCARRSLCDIVEGLRARWHFCPIVVALSSEDANMLQLFEASGGDDFIAELSPAAVIVTRLRHLLPGPLTMNRPISIGSGVVYDAVNHTLKQNATEMRLTLRESQVLHLLVARRGWPVRSEEIITTAWGMASDRVRPNNAVAVTICRLRRKLSTLGHEEWLRWVPGFGYEL